VHVKKTSTPFPLDLKKEKVNLFRPKKSILLKISHSLLTFSRHALFSIALTSRVRKRLLVKEQPSKWNKNKSQQLFQIRQNKSFLLPKLGGHADPVPWIFKAGTNKISHTVHGTKKIVITSKKSVSCQASCFQNPPRLLQQNVNWKQEKFLSIYFPQPPFSPTSNTSWANFLHKKITSSTV